MLTTNNVFLKSKFMKVTLILSLNFMSQTDLYTILSLHNFLID